MRYMQWLVLFYFIFARFTIFQKSFTFSLICLLGLLLDGHNLNAEIRITAPAVGREQRTTSNNVETHVHPMCLLYAADSSQISASPAPHCIPVCTTAYMLVWFFGLGKFAVLMVLRQK